MDAAEQISRFKELIEASYKQQLFKAVSAGKNSLAVSFSDISKFDPELAEALLEEPKEIIKAGEESIKELDLPQTIKNFRIRITDMPANSKLLIKDIRSKHLGKLTWVEGLVRQKSDVRPQVTTSRFECPSCGNIMTVLQMETHFREPTKCGCGRKGKFRMISKELVDVQGIVLEEIPENLEGGAQSKRVNIFLKEDLVSPISEKRTNPGSKIRVIGELVEVPVILRSGGKSTRFDLLIEANNVEAIEETFYEIEITKEEEDEIKKLAQDPAVYEKLVGSIAPSIYGYEKVKEALLLQLVGGVQKRRNDGMVTRGDMHILLIGDPGAGKSQLLKRISSVSPKGRYVSGKGVSGAGLTAAVVKDEFLGGWSLEAGALVLANNGLCCIDELDKMGNEDRAAMHEALEQQSVSISKANIQATLIARTTVLAAANPKFGRFDPYGIIAEQIDLPPTLINRFDLIFPIKDLPDEARDEKMARHILSLHQNPEFDEPEIPTKLLKKYIAYARRNINPVLTDSAVAEIKQFYVSMRNTGNTDRASRSIPISARQLEALVRLAEASARVRLSDKVTKRDAKRGIELLMYCLEQIGLDKETGKIDIDRISTGITASQRDRIYTIKDLISSFSAENGRDISLKELTELAAEKKISEGDVEEIVYKLKRSGDLYEPRPGFLKII